MSNWTPSSWARWQRIVVALVLLWGVPFATILAAHRLGQDVQSERAQGAHQPSATPGVRISGDTQSPDHNFTADSPNWADRWIAYGTWALVVATIALFIATFALWRTTLRAVKTASKDARKLLKQSQKHAERELRAHVFVDKSQVIFTGRDNKVVANVDVQFKNFGKTPAYDVRCICHGKWVEWPLTESDLVMPDAPFVGIDLIGPEGARLSRMVEEITPDQRTAMNGGTLEKPASGALFLFGRVTYVDAFQTQRWTNFRLYVGGPIDPRLVRNRHILQGGETQDIYGFSSHEGGNEAS